MTQRSRSILVLGLMSGTSADGIDVSLVRITELQQRAARTFPETRLLNFAAFPFPPAVRETVLRLANGASTSTREISQLNFRLGELFADAALRACKKFRILPRRISLIGSHGQTVYHQGAHTPFLGASTSSTLQIAEPAIIAERTGITTIADFRPADIAAGGQGAPLVPFVDYLLYRDARAKDKVGRIALNIGGIANLTIIPANAHPRDVIAFDTGPGNMIIDALAAHFTHNRLPFDRNSQLARRGHLLPEFLNQLLAHPFFRKSPPKTAGREEFGTEYTARLIALAKRHRIAPADLLHTATAFTAASIAQAIQDFVFPHARVAELILAGGGARNPLLVAYLAAFLPSLKNIPAGAFGIPADAKEAFAFAVLAYEAFQQHANNLPSATGARHPAVLGKICHARPR
ncbi:MAG TPA: anhydro-N-acetylmuramic acid kinase [Candidatus Acidoferrales bacterium]|nr:anhydro-N-acetylmuramic acid kinase [Candidatus Acidoferrales bacterium]